MKTDELINLLSQDSAIRVRFGQALGLALLAGVLLAGLFFFAAMGFRPDIDLALESLRFVFKLVVTLVLFLTATNLMMRIGRPGARLQLPAILLLLVPLLLVGSVVGELVAVPSARWGAQMIGHNAYKCLSLIPLLSIGPLSAFILALRQGAPEHPGRAGAVAGLAAGGIAAVFYASNCTDDSPLFVALWYTLAIGIVTGAGYLAGRRWLTW
ncbi:MAG: NrsF family protein [Pseudorhizobium sp.]